MIANVHCNSHNCSRIAAILTARELPGGRLLVNDAIRKRLVILDSALRIDRVVFDTIPGTDNYYGARPEPVISYLGDSTIFVDNQSRSFLLIEPSGKTGRVIAAPKDRNIFTTIPAAAVVARLPKDPFGSQRRCRSVKFPTITPRFVRVQLSPIATTAHAHCDTVEMARGLRRSDWFVGRHTTPVPQPGVIA